MEAIVWFVLISIVLIVVFDVVDEGNGQEEDGSYSCCSSGAGSSGLCRMMCQQNFEVAPRLGEH